MATVEAAMHGNRVDAAIDRVYARAPEHYLRNVLLLSLPLTEFVGAFPVTFAVGWVAGLPTATIWQMQATVFVALVLGQPIGLAVLRRFVMPDLVGFLRRGPHDPGRAWQQLVDAPRNNAVVVGTISFLIWIPLVLLLDLAPLEGVEVVLLFVGFVVPSSQIVTLWIPGGRLLFRPVLHDLAARHPEVVAVGRGGHSLRAAVAIAVAAAGVFGVLSGAALVAVLPGDAPRVLMVTGFALVFAAWFVTVATVMVSRPVLDPLDALTDATAAVAGGSLDRTLVVDADDEVGRLTVAFNAMTAGLRERERLHAAFGSYVDPALAERLLAQSDQLFAGEAVAVTVMFLDVRDFTPFAEANPPHVAVDRLNQLFEVVVPAIVEAGGHANKYLGDGVLAVFGAPEPHADHADRAVAAAARILLLVEEAFRDELRIGIGLNTGTAIAGTIGGGGKLEFTLIGDVVNVAARVEAHTKQTGDVLLLTDSTLEAIVGRPPQVVSRPAVRLKGTSRSHRLHAVVDPATSARDPVTGDQNGRSSARQR